MPNQKKMNKKDRNKLLKDVEAFCQELRPIEDLAYLEHKFNDQVPALIKKYKLFIVKKITRRVTFPEKTGRVMKKNLVYWQFLSELSVIPHMKLHTLLK